MTEEAAPEPVAAAPAPPPAPPPPPKKIAPPRAKAPSSGGGLWRLLAVGMVLAVAGGGAVLGGLLWFGGSRGAAGPGGSSLAAIQARGKLRVAADPNAPPFLMPDAAGGYSGYEWAVMSALQAVAGVPVEVVPAPYAELPKHLRKGDADLAIGQLTWDPTWKDLTPSVSYLQYSLCLVVAKESQVSELSQLTGQKIGIYEDPSTKRVIQATLGEAWQPVIFKDYGYFEQLATGQIAAVVYDCPLVRHELRRFPGLKVVDDSMSVASYSVLARSDSTDLMAKVNAVLVDLGNQGLLGKMEDRWLGSRPRGVRGRVVVVLPGETL
ncbi:MAG TPA: transporter substrate-binding domain-containing protein, partial [Myxococcota bacterium]|nr:transporter substrate-binding domain-containing protein [Myxococcota bacterium]